MDIATQRRKLQKQRSDVNVQKSTLYSATGLRRNEPAKTTSAGGAI